MSRLYTVLNYFCIAICAVGIYSSYRLLSLKPWKVDNLESKLAVQLDDWEAPRFGLATTTERALGEKKPDVAPGKDGASKPEVTTNPIIAADPKKVKNSQTAKNASSEPAKVTPRAVAVKAGKPEPKLIAVAKTEAAQLKPVPVEPKKVKAIAKTSKEVPKPELKVVSKSESEKLPAVVVAKAPVAKVTPKITKPETVLLADASNVKKPKMAENFPNTQHNTTQTNRQKTEKSPLREKNTTQTTPEKTTPVTAKKSTTISLSSMLEVDKGASAPR